MNYNNNVIAYERPFSHLHLSGAACLIAKFIAKCGGNMRPKYIVVIGKPMER